jgi:hypothetical protein
MCSKPDRSFGLAQNTAGMPIAADSLSRRTTRRIAPRVGWMFVVAAVLLGQALPALAGPPPAHALWNADRTAAVTATERASGTRVTAYLRQQDGTFLEVDLSPVEAQNFGRLGRARTEYEGFETVPITWHARADGLFQVTIRTRAWRAGQRYTASEPLILRPDGTVLWR